MRGSLSSAVYIGANGAVSAGKDDPASAEEVLPVDRRVWVTEGHLHVYTPHPEMVYIITFDGRVYASFYLPAGETAVALPPGDYIIDVGGRSYKMRF